MKKIIESANDEENSQKQAESASIHTLGYRHIKINLPYIQYILQKLFMKLSLIEFILYSTKILQLCLFFVYRFGTFFFFLFSFVSIFVNKTVLIV